MSYGWVTESALIPKKSKEIPVDSKSYLGLQTQVFELSQQKNNNPKISTSKSLKEILCKDEIVAKGHDSKQEIDNRSNSGLIERCKMYESLKNKGNIDENFLVEFKPAKDSDISDFKPVIIEDVEARPESNVKQSYDHTLTYSEKKLLPEVIIERGILKQQQALLKRKRQDRLELRREKVRQMKLVSKLPELI